MRNSVLCADLLLYVPSVLYFINSFKGQPSRSSLTLAAFMLYSGQILIDNGHFQYNNISLGLFVLAVAFLLRQRPYSASVAFVAALSYKQMELYHALPFFFYLLGLCWQEKSIFKLIKIGLCVIVTFALLWWPFLPHLPQVLTRIFPVKRGLFEDKVSNFWCALNVVFKLKATYQPDLLALLSAVATLAFALPPNLVLFKNPRPGQMIWTLLNTSLAFFLFSYQVHEKSILLVAIPMMMTLALNRKGQRFCDLMTAWFLLTTTFSMWPLLQKDGLALAAVALQVIFLVFCQFSGLLDIKVMQGQDEKRSSPKAMTSNDLAKTSIQDFLVWTAFNLSLVGFAVLVFGSLLMEPPKQYPHLWPLLISLFSAAHYLMAFVPYFWWCQYQDLLHYTLQTKEKKLN